MNLKKGLLETRQGKGGFTGIGRRQDKVRGESNQKTLYEHMKLSENKTNQ